jgi:DNA-binding response OmpR family regulator
VILVDVQVRGMGGLEVLRHVRANDLSVAVVLSTADDSEEERAAAFAAGADEYLIKPYSLDELRARLDRLTSRPSRTADARSPREKPPAGRTRVSAAR